MNSLSLSLRGVGDAPNLYPFIWRHCRASRGSGIHANIGTNALKHSNSNTLTRDDLADAVYREIGLSKTESSQLVNALINKIEDSLTTDGIVKLAGFGNFVTRLKPERKGRNPKTGQPVIISPRRVVTFKPSTKLIERVDQSLSQRTQIKDMPLTLHKWKTVNHG